MLAVAMPDLSLRAVPRGLARRTYQQVVLAWPQPSAAAFDPAWFADYPSIRIQLQYAVGPEPRGLAILATETNSPSMVACCHDHGWHALRIPPLGAAWLISQQWLPCPMRKLPMPACLLLPSMPGSHATIPDDAMPEPPPPASPESLENPSLATPPEVASTEDLSSRLLADLRAVLAGEAPFRRIMVATAAAEGDHHGATANTDPLVDPAPSPFPVGPGSGKSAMPPTAVAGWVERLLSYPQGYTRKTIAALLHEAHKEHAALLLRWLDAAQLLGPASDPSQPYRYPRALIVADQQAIAERLRHTPLPEAVAS
jgi:hypothetical protein